MRQRMHLAAASMTCCVLLVAILVAGYPCRAQEAAPPRWHDTLTARLEALALLQTLNADLLSHESATLTLERWCQRHRMASPARIVAERLSDVDKPPTPLQRQELEVTATELIRYRRVRLRCGEHVLSEAENWYVPGRLTPDMNRLLETTDVPFGRVVQSLHFWRRIFEANLVWSPLSPDWDNNGKPANPRSDSWPDVQSTVLQHRAVLVLSDGRPISEVIENYTAAVLAFPEPRAEH